MPRKRLISPSLAKNERLADMGYEAQLLFALLPTLADREGRLEDRPRYIAVECFPYSDVDVDAILTKLASHDGPADVEQPLIVRYEVAGRKLIQITGWAKDQSPHPKEEQSQLPAPAEDAMLDSSMNDAQSMHGSCMNGASAMHHTRDKKEKKEKKPRGGVGESGKQPSSFAIPTIDEVAAYCSAEGIEIDVDHFWNHHNASGWKLTGGRSMKCWKSAIVTWKKNEGKYSRNGHATQSTRRSHRFQSA